MTKGVYCLTFKNNGKKYVGMSNYSIENRFSIYRGLHCKTQTRLFNALNKHKPENVKFEILAVCDDTSFNLELEQYLIEKLKLQNPAYGYNTTSGGECPTFSEEAKEKMQNKIMSEEARRNMSIAKTGNQCALGHKHTEETKEKQRIAQTGKIASEEARRKMSIAKTGMNHHKAVLIRIKNTETGEEAEGCCAELARKHGFNRNQMSYKGKSKGWIRIK